MSSDSQSSFFNERLDAPNDSLSIEVAIEPLIDAISHLAEVNEPYMISISVSVGEGPKKQYVGSWHMSSCLRGLKMPKKYSTVGNLCSNHCLCWDNCGFCGEVETGNCFDCVLIYVPFSSFRSAKSWVSPNGITKEMSFRKPAR